MGVKLMTGATGEQNIQAADDRECLAGITGLDSYVFPTGSQLKATLVDANTVTIGTGAGSLQGSRFRCSTTTTVNIQSGTQGQFRHDIVGLHFSRETSGREGLEFQVLTGEPAASEGAAADPEYTAGDLLKGDAEAFMPLYRVKLSGINASDPEPMFSVLTPLSTLRDSVSELKSDYVFKAVDTGSIEFCRVGGIVVMNMYNIVAKVSGPWGTALVGTVPEGFRPKNQLRQRCQVANVDNSMSSGLWVQSGGAMYVANFGGTGLSGSYSFSCTACWPAA
nr:MAG TPA: hypothetical protein [Caudoviricetes sp.]